MTVRLLLQDEYVPRSSRRSVKWAECVLLLLGLFAVDFWIWSNVDTVVAQAYDSWSLDRQIHRRRPSWRGFVADRLRVPALAPPEIAEKVQAHRRVVPNDELLGRVEVPRLGLSATVREGVEDSVLQRAVGHMPSTAMPGEPGNVAIAAHRDTLFRKLRGIRRNDTILMQTASGEQYRYEVESMKIVQPSDVNVLRAAPGEQSLTLITCYPFNYVGSAPQRFIVKARQVKIVAQSRPTAPAGF